MSELATAPATSTDLQLTKLPHGPTGAARLTRRTARALAPVLLFLAAALVQLYPYRSPELTQHAEICWNTAGVLEARRAMAEGQFPARVANHQAFGPRYPIFQFYAALPYNGGAVLMAATGDRIGPYAALKLELWLAVACGGYFTYRMAYLLTRHRSAARLAGLVFVTAPYLFCDVRARGAVSETMAMCLTPAAMYLTVRCWRSRRWVFIPLVAVAWSAVALSHNITYMYAGVFVSLYIALAALWGLAGVARRPRRWRRLGGRFGRLAVAGVLHGLLVAWYVVPSLTTASQLHVGYAGAATASPFASRVFTTVPYLAAPAMSVHPESTTQFLGLQVGWPILASAVVSAGVAARAAVRGEARRRAAVGVLLPFAAAVLLTWSPVDVWRYLPRLFYYVQWTYRVLVFVVVFGSILAGVALAACFPHGRGGMRPAVVGLAVLLLAVAAGSYVNDAGTLGPDGMKRLYAAPQIGILPDYLLSTRAAGRTSWVDAADNLAEPQWGLVPTDGIVRGGVQATVPVPAGATALAVEGTIPPGQTLPVTISLNAAVAGGPMRETRQVLSGGPFWVVVPVEAGAARVEPGRPAGQVFVVLNTAAGADPGPAPAPAVLQVSRVAWQGEQVAADPLPQMMTKVAKVAAGAKARGRVGCSVKVDQPTRVVLPVLYYPRLLEVRADGEPVPYGNVGRYVAVEVPAGRHRVDVRFVGIGWANIAGLIGVGGVGLGLAAGLLERRLPRLKRRKGV